MRTTISIDDDVASRLRPLLERNKPKKVINDLLRRALGIEHAEVELATFKLELKPGIDPISFNKLSDELSALDDAGRLVP